MRDALEQLRDKINTVYLVGGFGGCKFVSHNIEKAIHEYHGDLYDNVVCPRNPDLAVTIGAVMWRKDPNIIQSRIADATYGISIAPVFNASKHDEHYRFIDEDDKPRCDYVFEVFVLKGEVTKDEVYKTTLIPYSQSYTQVCTDLYCTTDDGVQYVISKDGKATVLKIGKLVLDTPNPDNVPKIERKFDILMDFSGTEIQAKAKYSITGKEVKTVCDFLCNQD